MNAAMKVPAIQSDWIGRVIDGRFMLLQWLGGSGRSSVYLTEMPGEPPKKAAIKLMPADAGVEARIAFAGNASRAHEHLMRVLQIGRCDINGRAYEFVVTEFADEVLSEILPMRSLAPEEVKEMLVPVLDALTDLHGHGLVHSRLKPSNILVVNDELKLSPDSLQFAGASADEMPGAGVPALSIYDAPERVDGTLTSASDIWSLGVMMFEALTQHTPDWNRSSNRDVHISETIPQPFAATIAACLRVDPARRATLKDIRGRLALPAPVAPVAPTRPDAAATPVPAAPPVAAATPVPAATPPPKPAEKSEPRPASQNQPRPATQAQWKPSAQPQSKPGGKANRPARAQQKAAQSQPKPAQPKPEAKVEAKPVHAAHEATPVPVAHYEPPPPPRALPQFAFERPEPRRKSHGGVLVFLALIVIAAASLLWFHSHGTLPATKSNDQPPAQSSAPAPAMPQIQPPTSPTVDATPEPEQQLPPPGSAPPATPAVASGQSSTGAVKGAVANRVMADVPSSASRTIHGTLNVRVRVNVSPQGDVTDASFESAGPSRYFARLAMEAARQWKFTPPRANGQPVASIWTLDFRFTRENSDVTPVQTAP